MVVPPDPITPWKTVPLKRPGLTVERRQHVAVDRVRTHWKFDVAGELHVDVGIDRLHLRRATGLCK